jgi:hypothetical protein
VKWSSMRKGEKSRSLAVPTERRTLAPTPSDCSTARNALRIARETDMADLASCILGTTDESPLNEAEILIALAGVCSIRADSTGVARESDEN